MEKMEKKKEGFLKFIIIYKGLLGVMELVIPIGLLGLLDRDIEALGTELANTYGINLDEYYLTAPLKEFSDSIDNTLIMVIAGGIFLVGVLNVVECWGLHLRRRWAEWLTVVATSIFIPFELYKVAEKLTVTMISILVLNCAIVYYLAKHKELFKSKKAVRESASG
ncbi:MAG: DUF2127 domain-containing protein [Thermodesulfobacteriota bacterium]